jgi:hypothetical protein
MHTAGVWIGPGARTNEDVAWPHGPLVAPLVARSRRDRYRKLGA